MSENEPAPLTAEQITEGLRLDAARTSGFWLTGHGGFYADHGAGQSTTLKIVPENWAHPNVTYLLHAANHYGAALRQLQAQAAELGRLRAERDEARAALKQCWDTAGLLDERMTGQPWQHYDPDSVRCDLVPQIEQHAGDAEALKEVEAERDAARALAARLAEQGEGALPWCDWCQGRGVLGTTPCQACLRLRAALAEARAAGVVPGKGVSP